MSIFFETVPKKNIKTHTPLNENIRRYSPKKTKRPNPIGHEMSIFIETVPQKNKHTKDSGTYPKSEMSILLGTVTKKQKYQNP